MFKFEFLLSSMRLDKVDKNSTVTVKAQKNERKKERKKKKEKKKESEEEEEG